MERGDAGEPRRCRYVYCGAEPVVGDRCQACGYPVDEARLADRDFLFESLPPTGLGRMTDMHQILPTKPGNFELQLAMMERLGIERALLQSVPSKVTSIAGNERLREVRASHPNTFVISHFTDPRLPFVGRKLRRYAEAGVRVIKLVPSLGFDPDQRWYDGFWAAMEEHGMAAMVHTGFITARHKAEEKRAGVFLASRWGRPIYFDRVARKFPRLRVILCHMGGSAWYEEACLMVSQHDNVWGDFAGPGIAALRRILRLGVELDWNRVFWGNDSAADCYPFNLRLLLGALEAAGRSDLAPRLLHGNGQRFLDALQAPAAASR